jgi:hypothetical protein
MKALVFALGLLVLVAGGLGLYLYHYNETHVTIEHTDYHPPAADPNDTLADDRLEDRNPAFDPWLVDSRPLGEWLVNASAAVVRLDCPMVRPDVEPDLLTLHRSYAAAGQGRGRDLLPSVNLCDGKAKQFDDGLYAALDRAYYRGLQDRLHSHVQLVRRFYDRAGRDSPAAPFLAAGLKLAGVEVDVADAAAREALLEHFRGDPIASKPIGLYTWSDELAACFRFLRFFAHKFGPNQLVVPQALARALAQDAALRADYQKVLDFYARLTNPPGCLSVADLLDQPKADGPALEDLRQRKHVPEAVVALLPPSTSRETVLFNKLFPLGLPPDANLMRELVNAIRSGTVDLRPKPDSGWYDYQVYALETLLLPEKGPERDKLLLTRAYKKRMLEAFQALITKRRETHVRHLGAPGAAAAPPKELSPRLRVEPCPSYFLRTARAYAFLANFLEAAVGKEGLQQLHGLKEGGERSQDLRSELHWMRDLFYGLHLVSCEDLGMRPALTDDEPVDRNRCYKLADDWLPKALQDEDLAADTRVAVPVYVDPGRGITRVWLTLGVRLAKLDAQYARPPRIKPAKEPGDWKDPEPYLWRPVNYLIPVDEFAEVELRGRGVMTREEFRALCDRERTREAILHALGTN